MEKIPKKILNKVAKHFNGNLDQANLWFIIRNPMLHNMRPIDYAGKNRWDLLEKKIDKEIEEAKNVFTDD